MNENNKQLDTVTSVFVLALLSLTDTRNTAIKRLTLETENLYKVLRFLFQLLHLRILTIL